MMGSIRNATALAGVLVAVAASGGAPAQAGVPCSTWGTATVASGLGSLENLEFDGRGGLLVSATNQGAIVRLRRGAAPAPVVSGVRAPGGLRVRGGAVFFTTGNAAASAVAGLRDGTFESADLDTGRRTALATGLIGPNGLAFLPNGDAVTSRALGSGTGITRLPAADPSRKQENWARLDGANGLVVDPTGTWLYTVETFTAESRVFRIRIGDPSRIETVASLGRVGVPRGLDDIDMDAAGVLYMAANGSGEVLRLDPRSGALCTLARGIRNPSAVKLGRGPDWSARKLYVTAFDGAVRELTPPPGQEPAVPSASTPPRCRARKPVRFRVPDPKGRERIIRAKARVDGRRVKVRRRGRRFVVRVRPGRRPVTRVKVMARTNRGRLLRIVRRYRFCPAS